MTDSALQEAKTDNGIPEWIIKYDKANYQSGAGKAVRFLIERCKKLDEVVALLDNIDRYGVTIDNKVAISKFIKWHQQQSNG